MEAAEHVEEESVNFGLEGKMHFVEFWFGREDALC